MHGKTKSRTANIFPANCSRELILLAVYATTSATRQIADKVMTWSALVIAEAIYSFRKSQRSGCGCGV